MRKGQIKTLPNFNDVSGPLCRLAELTMIYYWNQFIVGPMYKRNIIDNVILKITDLIQGKGILIALFGSYF